MTGPTYHVETTRPADVERIVADLKVHPDIRMQVVGDVLHALWPAVQCCIDALARERVSQFDAIQIAAAVGTSLMHSVVVGSIDEGRRIHALHVLRGELLARIEQTIEMTRLMQAPARGSA